jgi:hypothetical protein
MAEHDAHHSNHAGLTEIVDIPGLLLEVVLHPVVQA